MRRLSRRSRVTSASAWPRSAPVVPADAELDEPVRDGTRLTGRMALALFDAMASSRNLDLAARYLRKEGPGVYTIGSAGHESNAVVAAALRPTDPALLHYRSGGFYCARAQQVPDSTPLRDVLLGLVAAADEPISGGRHKVFGNHALAVIPQTSTIASHVPRAMGVGFAIERAQRIGVSPAWPEDAIAVCSFGDASLNHSTALGALNAAEYNVHQGLRMPVLFCCEDNGFGISVRTPRDWVKEAWSNRPHLRYFGAEGTDIAGAYDAAVAAAEYVRNSRRPAFLHLRTVRFLGHAGSDAEIGYRSRAEIGEELERDPLVHAARLLAEAGIAEPDELLARYDDIAAEVRSLADDAADQAAPCERIGGDGADRAAAAGSDRQRREPGGGSGRKVESVCGKASGGSRPAYPGRVDQRDADRRARGQAGDAGLR